jgi:hypothetical protein
MNAGVVSRRIRSAAPGLGSRTFRPSLRSADELHISEQTPRRRSEKASVPCRRDGSPVRVLLVSSCNERILRVPLD